MRKLHYILILAATIMMFSCKGNAQQTQGIEELKQKVHASNEFKTYVSTTKEIMRFTRSDEFSYNGVDREMLGKALRNIKNKEEAIAAYQKAGVKGAEVIGSLMYNQHKALVNILKNYPELRKLNEQDFKSIIRMNLTSHPDSITPPNP